jgi:hypothetical protein
MRLFFRWDLAGLYYLSSYDGRLWPEIRLVMLSFLLAMQSVGRIAAHELQCGLHLDLYPSEAGADSTLEKMYIIRSITKTAIIIEGIIKQNPSNATT